MITVREVTKRFKDIKAVDCVSFNVKKGEAVALLGANGAGKSTLIKCILGLLSFEGEITLNGLNVEKSSKEAKSLIGYVPQEPVFYDMRALDILEFFGAIRGVDMGRIEEIVNLVGLREHILKQSSALSGGMKQRLSFAIALISNPPILVLDEPTSNLDAHARAEFLKLIRELKLQGKTVLFSSHRLDEVEFLADRVVVMKSGKVVMESKPNVLAETLGLKVRMYIKVPVPWIETATDILKREGFDAVTLNENTLLLEVTSREKTIPLKKLLFAEIPVEDLGIEEPSMERIMQEVQGDGI
ncbi:MAG: ABC transporter ATP-binding protein [Deltaproteobacteria bacterium]|nr:MAG: ABC transporter ATP-binding protein [Deltaproteobacteria bacterium]